MMDKQMASPYQTDPENMFAAIFHFPDQMAQAMDIGEKISLKYTQGTIRNIIIAGMGGSAIGGDVVSTLVGNQLKIPFIVNRHYDLPSWVNDETLVIVSSYSGNTEETLSAYEQANNRGAQVCGITTGGKLGLLLDENQQDNISIPGGLQPRAALAFSFIPMLWVLHHLSLIDSSFINAIQTASETIRKNRERYSLENDENPTYALAQQVCQLIPVIYGANPSTSTVAVRWKGQLAENAKMPAYQNELPELNHNEIVGWENNPNLLEKLLVIWLKDESDHPRIKHRQTITRSILAENNVQQTQVSVEGASLIERIIHLIYFGDWVSFWCALRHGTDPSPVHKIDTLKQELGKLSQA